MNVFTTDQQLYLIRHATTDMAGTLCGHADPPLNATGREQALQLARMLQNTRVQRLYSSDLKRAVETALPLAKLWDIPILKRIDFREISFGTWEGMRWSEVRTAGTDITSMELSPELGAPGGETFGAFRARIMAELRQALAGSEGHTTAIVTHLGVIRVLLNDFAAMSPNWHPHHKIDYCSVYRLRVSGSCLSCLNQLEKNRELA